MGTTDRRPALWTRHRGIALGIAADYRIPRLDPDDVRQEALVALWEATGVYDPARGTFPALARTVVHRHLRDLLQAATRLKRTADFDREVDPMDVRDRIAARLQLVDLARAHLTPTERKAIRDHVNGAPTKSSRRHGNALQRARRKLRDAD